VSFSAIECARARESISARLDGELLEQELEPLEMHLSVCSACSEWAEEVQDTTRLLREACFEDPPERFVLTGRKRGWRVGSAIAVASAAVVVAAMFVASGSQNGSIGSLAAGPPASDLTYDVKAGVIYAPHPALGSVTLGVSFPRVAARPVPDL
jgi:predicted anti-sigma-YlaC factor YlaD